MAEQLLGGPTGGAEVGDGGDGGLPALGTPEVEGPQFQPGEQTGDNILPSAPRAGDRLPERALKMQRVGSGPHVSMGRDVERLVDTAGRRNQLFHGATGPAATSGAETRGKLMTAREARQDGRDVLHYREDFGTTLTDEGHKGAVEQGQKFQKYVGDVNKQLDVERGRADQQQKLIDKDWANYQQGLKDVATSRTNVAKEVQKQKGLAKQAYDANMGKLPTPKRASDSDLNNAYNKWYNDSKYNHPVRIYSGFSPDNPGGYQGTYRIPKEQLPGIFNDMVHKGGLVVHNNNVYVKQRGQEWHDALRNGVSGVKKEWMQQAKGQAEQVYQQNLNDYRLAQELINTTYQESLLNIDLSRQEALAQIGVHEQQLGKMATGISNARSELAGFRGAIKGRQEGLQMEIGDRNQALKEVRDSYSSRLGKIDQALNQQMQRTSQSRSEGYQPRQINPLRPAAQQAQAQAQAQQQQPA